MSRFFRQTLHIIASRGMLLILGVATGILTARLLGPEGKGLLAKLLVLPMLAAALGEMGIRQSIAYLVGQQRYKEADIQASMMALFLMTASVGLAVVLIGYWALGVFDSGWVLPLVVASLAPLALLQKYAGGLFLGRQRIERINYIQLLHQGGRFVLVAALVALAGWGVLGAGVGFVAAQGAALALLLFWVGRRASLRPRWISPIPTELLKRGLVYGVSLLVLVLNYRVNILMLGKMRGDASVGIFTTGMAICELLRQLPLAVGAVLFSHSVGWRPGQAERKLRSVVLLARIILFLAIVSAGVIAAVAWWVVPFAYGQAFQDSARVVWVLLPGTVALSAFLTLHLFAAGQGRPELALYAFGPGLVLNVVLNLCLIPKWDYLGAALGSVISYAFAVLIFLLLFRRRYHVKLREILVPRPSDLAAVLAYRKGAS